MGVIFDDSSQPVLDTDDDEILDTWDDDELFSPFGLRVEVEFSSGTWTDIADEVFLAPVRITRGRQDWSSEAAPARLSFSLDNDHGHFTPGNRLSPYWPGVTRGVPIRVVVEHEGADYTRFVGSISSWHVSWPDGDVSDETVDHLGVCEVEVEAAGVLAEMQRGPSKTPVVWTMGRRNLFRVDARSHIRVDPDWRYASGQISRNPRWRLDAPSLPVRFMFFLDAAAIGGSSPFTWELASWNRPVSGGMERQGDVNIDWTPPPNVGDPAPAPELVVANVVNGAFGTEIVQHRTSATPFLGRWVLLTFELSGTSTTLTLQTADGVSQAFTTNGLAYSSIPAFLSGWLIEGSPSGDVRWYVDPTLNVSGWQTLLQAASSYPGETPEARTTRILAEGGFPAPVIEGASGAYMGPQPTATAIDVARDAALAGGLLVEDVASLALRLRTWGSLFNQPAVVLDAAEHEITVPLDVILDEQGWVTQVTARNRLDDEVVVGSSASPYVPESIDRNVADATQLASHASWRLHLGTIDDPRAPAITLDLAHAPDLIPTVAALTEGDVIRIENLPSQWPFPTLDLMIQGSAPEELLPDSWAITWNCTPGGPWSVGELTDGAVPDPVPDYDGRLDTEACELVAAVDADDTSFDVTTTAGPVWVNSTDHPDEFPLLIEVAGEVMTVTAATAPSSGVQTFTVTRGDDARPHATGTAVMVAQPLIVAI